MRSISQAVVQANPANHPVIAIPVTSIHKPTISRCRKRMGSSFMLNWRICSVEGRQIQPFAIQTPRPCRDARERQT
jgi:hypothetical protein